MDAERIRILIADDHPLFRDGLHGLLDSVPDTEVVGEATDGKEAVELANRLQPDVILMDLMMPGMDGWEVLDRIRRDATTYKIPVVVLTAHAEEESRRRANEGGADAFVTKPFQPNDFRSTVLSLLE